MRTVIYETHNAIFDFELSDAIDQSQALLREKRP